MEAFNRTLFLQINGGDGMPAWLIHLAIGLADGLIYLIPLLFLARWLWGNNASRSQALKACLVTLLALGANQVIGVVGVSACAYLVVSPLWRIIQATVTVWAERVYRAVLARPIHAGWIRR